MPLPTLPCHNLRHMVAFYAARILSLTKQDLREFVMQHHLIHQLSNNNSQRIIEPPHRPVRFDYNCLID